MKLWRGLTAVQQQRVRNAEIISYTKALLEIGGDFIGPDDHPVRQRFEELAREMERMQTPWFLGESVLHDPVMSEWIREEVDQYIQEAWYLAPGELALHEPIIKNDYHDH
jgi:hypothetical protein